MKNNKLTNPQSHSHDICSTTVRHKGRNEVVRYHHSLMCCRASGTRNEVVGYHHSLMWCRASATRNDGKGADGRKAAFTLAEVLITLGIIGIVAAMTIPTLVAKYQEKAWNTSATVFERKLEEALKVMNTRETLAGYNNTKDFVNELSNHFKITKICDTVTDCFEETVYFGAGEADPEEVDMTTITSAKSFGQDDWGTETVGVQFGNGTSGVIAYNPDCKQDPYSNQITGTSCLALLYDTTGHSKPNTSGKDLRSINVSKLGSACAFTGSNGTCFGTAFYPTTLSYSECEEVKDDLGINECYSGTDYWAGAVKACGGIQNMPSQEQLTELAEYLYDATISSSGRTYATLDTNKTSSLGFDLSVTVMVWSANELNSDVAYVRSFNSDSTNWFSDYRYNSGRQAVCIN